MFRLLVICLLCAAFQAPAQDSLTQKSDTPFGQRFLERMNPVSRMELFNHIADSRRKCADVAYNPDDLWQWEGKTIASITIEVLDPFGHLDTATLKRPRFYELANKVHRTTSERMIRQELLFREGQAFKPEQVIASQELLYENDYLRNAAIMVAPDEYDENAVHLYILVQDLWSWQFFGEVSGDYIGGNLAFNKFLGLPQRFTGGLKFNFDRDNPVTPVLRYDYRNIAGSFTDVSANWSHDWRNYTYEAELRRGFFSPRPQWAGGARIGWYRRMYDDLGGQAFHNKQDFWLARSFPLQVLDRKFMNIVLAGRVIRLDYTGRPPETPDLNEASGPDFSDQTHYLTGIGVASRKVVREHQLFDFWPYRLVPVGFNMHVVGGVIYNDRLLHRGYAGLTVNHALMTCAGFFLEEFGASTYISGGVEQVTFSLKSKYFTHRFPMRRWGFRQYVYQSFVVGLNRPEGENLLLDDGDVRGLRLKDFEGSSYYSLNLESEIHSPVRFMGFQARLFVFADLGVQGGRSSIPLAGGSFYHVYGAGIRLNHWKLGMPYLELSLAWYPVTDGLNNRAVEFAPQFYNSKEINRNSLYNWDSLNGVH